MNKYEFFRDVSFKVGFTSPSPCKMRWLWFNVPAKKKVMSGVKKMYTCLTSRNPFLFNTRERKFFQHIMTTGVT